MARSLRSLSGSIAAAPTHRAIFAPHPKTSACHHPLSQRQPGLACDPHLNHALIELHPDAGGFRLALGTSSGRDIESVVPDLVAAEVFSATRPTSNQKLKKDVARLSSDAARHRYVFFAAPGFAVGRQEQLETTPGIQVYAVEP